MMFSVIVPVYNVATYLRDALESVLAQSYGDWECICVNDGSTDDSASILSEFANRDARFRILAQENQGEGMARNAGLDGARGDWVVFLDSDDVLAPWALDAFRRLMGASGNSAELLRLDLKEFTDKTEPFPSLTEVPGDNFQIKDVERELCDEALFFGFSRYAYSRNSFGQIRFGRHLVGADRVYLAKALTTAKKICIGHDVVYAYRQRIGSAMHSNISLQKLLARLEYSREWLDVLAHSPKRIGRAIYRLILNNVTEDYIDDLKYLPVQGRMDAWQAWLDFLPCLRAIRGISIWARFVVITCSFFKSRYVAYFLCVFPLWIKRMGIHR